MSKTPQNRWDEWDELVKYSRRLESDRAELIEALTKAADTFADFAKANRALGRSTMAQAADIAEEHARALLARLEGK